MPLSLEGRADQGTSGRSWLAVEGPVVQALGLEKDHRVVALVGRDQQPFGVVGVARHHGAQPADMREQRLGALAVRLPAVDAAAAGHADRDRIVVRAWLRPIAVPCNPSVMESCFRAYPVVTDAH